jgi:hypothetical protein
MFMETTGQTEIPVFAVRMDTYKLAIFVLTFFVVLMTADRTISVSLAVFVVCAIRMGAVWFKHQAASPVSRTVTVVML